MKKTWLLRLPNIREELVSLKVPVIDRAMFEKIFGVRRRRAIQLMNYFDAYQSGRTLLIDRLALLEKLAPLEASAEFAIEQRRRQRLVQSLEELRRSRAARRVIIALEPQAPNGTVLPDGVRLERGMLQVNFGDVQDLLRKLYAICQEAAHDFESFRAAAEGTPRHGSSLVAWPAGSN